MDDLKQIIEMVHGLPTLAVWVLVGYLVYKIAVIGSIYGLLRFLIDRLHSWLTGPRVITKEWDLDEITIDDRTRVKLINQIMRSRNHGLRYMHPDDVEWLRKAIDEYEANHGPRNNPKKG